MGPENEIFIDNSDYDYETMDHETRLHILENQMIQCMSNFKVLGRLMKELSKTIDQLQRDADRLKSDNSPQTDAHFK